MKNLKRLTAAVLSTMFISMQMSFACIDTGLGNGIGGATINSTKGGFEGMTKGANTADLNFSSNSVVNWNNLNVNKGETLNFNAVNGSRNLTVLNTVNQGMSKLYGNINANNGIKNLIISNPNGVLFDGTHFTSAGDVTITTQDMTNLTLNDLTNKNFKKGEFKNLYDKNGNPIGIQAQNNATFEVAGKLNIISPNHKMSISGKQKLITDNGLDYLEFDGHACNNCTNKAVNDHGNIIIVDINTAEFMPKQTVKPEPKPQPVCEQHPGYHGHHGHYNHKPQYDRSKHHGNKHDDFIVTNGRVGYNITKDFQRVKPISRHNDVVKDKMPGHNFMDKDHHNMGGHRPDFNGHNNHIGHGQRPDFNNQNNHIGQGQRPDFNGQNNHIGHGQKPDFDGQNNHIGHGQKPDFNGQNNQSKTPDFIVTNGKVGYNVTKDFQRVKPVSKSNDVLVDKMPGHNFLDKNTNARHPQGSHYQPAVSQTSYTPTAPITSVPKLDSSDYTKSSNIPTKPYTNIGAGIIDKPQKTLNPCGGSSCTANGFGNSMMNNQMPNAIKTSNSQTATNVKLSEQYYVRGLQKMILGDLEGGKADFTKAIENNAQNADAFYYRANINKQLGNIDGFNADTAKAASIDTKFQRVAPVDAVAYGI